MSVYTQIIAFALGLPSIITVFYPYNRNSIILYLYSSFKVLKKFIKLSSIFFFQLKKQSTNFLRQIIPNNACSPRITAAAGTELAGTFSLGTVFFLP